MKAKLIKGLSLANILGLIALLVLPILYFTPKAEAAGNLNIAMVRINNMVAGSTTTGTVCGKAYSNPTNVAHVAIQFPSNWTVSATLTNWAIDVATTTGWPTGATAWPGVGQATAADNGTKIVIFPSTSMVNTTSLYCFNWTVAASLTSNGTPANNQVGYMETQVSGGTAIDHSPIAFATVSSDTIQTTGTVDPTFSFSLPTNTDNFTTSLTNGATAATTGSTATITTNARNGWTTWVKSANAALHSASPGSTDITSPGTYDGTPTTLSAGTTGYVLKVATSGGSSSPAAEYTDGGNTDKGGTLTTAYNIAATESAPSSAETVTFTERARVAVTQAPASDYTDTLTVVAAGMF